MVPSKKISLIGRDGGSVEGVAELVFHGQPNVQARIKDSELLLGLNGESWPEYVKIYPINSYWSRILKIDETEEKEFFSPIRPDSFKWWLNILKKDHFSWTQKNGTRKIRIGVIDLPFSFEFSAQYTKLSDMCDDGDFVSCLREKYQNTYDTTHGMRTFGILAGFFDRDCQEFSKNNFEFVFWDTSSNSAPLTWSYDKMLRGIEVLSADYNVDIISISGGAYLNPEDREYEGDVEYAEEIIDGALDNGTTVFCACGNDPHSDVAYPGKVTSSIGVGAVGLEGVGPKFSRLWMYEQIAKEAGMVGALGNSKVIFHHPESSSGLGLNVVAPGAGVTLNYGNGVCSDYFGTSYSTPLASLVTAINLANDRKFCSLEGRERALRGIQILRASCLNLGMSGNVQGLGMPLMG